MVVILPFIRNICMYIFGHSGDQNVFLCCSVTKLGPTLCGSKDCSTPGSSVFHCLLIVKLVSIESVMPPNHLILCCPLSPPALNLSQHRCLSQWVRCLHQVVKVLELQHQSFQWTFRVGLLYDWLVLSPCCPRDSQESSPAPQFESINFLALSLLYGPALTSVHDYWKNHSFD